MMQQTCDSPLTCLAHGLAWPCELCAIENNSSTTCQRCGLSGAPGPSFDGRHVCAGWLRSAPVYPATLLDRDAQAPMGPEASKHPSERWLRIFQRLGLDVSRANGMITSACSDEPSKAGASAVTLRFSDGMSAVLCRPTDVEFEKPYDSDEFNLWTPEIRFDDEVLHWKGLESVESRDLPTGAEEHGSAVAGSISRLWIYPWSELRSLKVTVLRAHGPTPSRVADIATPRVNEDREAPGEVDHNTDCGQSPLAILRDLDSERDTGVQIVSVEAWETADGAVVIVGELETISGKKLDDYREVQFVVYDAADKVLGRSYTNFGAFGRRQTFDVEISELRPGGRPAKVRVFPSCD